MERFVLIDAQWAKMEPHCLGKPTNPGRSATGCFWRRCFGLCGRVVPGAIILMDDLRSRLSNRVQLTTHGHHAYVEAVEGAFGADVDYAQL